MNPGSREFYKADAFTNWKLPWGWDLGKQWRLQTGLEITGGWLTDVGKDAAVGSLGPHLTLSWGRLPITLRGGVSPTLLSSHEFSDADLGINFQFTTHVGVDWNFARHWSVGYRYEHISNADISPSNPGLNMSLLGLTYRF